MNPRSRHLLLAWGLLIALLAIEFGASFLALDRTARPLILIPAALMIAVVSVTFMELRRGPEPIRLFFAAGLLWLCILLGLGSLDPMTRINYLVLTTNLK
jgi:caa(3)-type oxidase subunit IV